jgi:hypothetical protein
VGEKSVAECMCKWHSRRSIESVLLAYGLIFSQRRATVVSSVLKMPTQRQCDASYLPVYLTDPP